MDDELTAAFRAMGPSQRQAAIRAAADIICQRDLPKYREAGREEAAFHQVSGG